ncbi:MAG: class I SAM-dependent methyltransferase [Nanoarchaeota archaeon]|nr:class I SAM-dependent methyltransferase [Nanoarchaeota archaeon]
MRCDDYNKRYYTQKFSKEAENYYQIHAGKVKRVLSLFETHHKGKILDIGCSDGYITERIARITGAVPYGIDISSTSVNEARKRGIKAKTFNMERGGLPYPENTFDAIYCGDVIEHLFDTEKFLCAIRAMLKPTGYLVLSTPNIASWYNRFFLVMGLMPVWIESAPTVYVGNPIMKEPLGHIRAFTLRSLTELLIKEGFYVDKAMGAPIYSDGSYNKYGEAIIQPVEKFFSNFKTLASVLLVKARPIN